MTRRASLQRQTSETSVSLTLDLDGQGKATIQSGIGFLDHMLTHIAHHGLLDLTIEAQGDTHIDDHHLTEDVGIVFGQVLRQALGDRAGIQRYGQAILPMDEALVIVALDCSGRGLLTFDGHFPTDKIGTFDCELVPEFLRAVAHNAGLTLHARVITGQNSHHIAEALFKGLGRALRQAIEVDPRRAGMVPSTKGKLE
ncbi:MAG: imidazoleglycerol-phosphate dehydratase HisB [Chloroflexi bacterium]|nr:imidazoleglycerol-phosphate dehydratase HisB [Chloroflexota bacterium]